MGFAPDAIIDADAVYVRSAPAVEKPEIDASEESKEEPSQKVRQETKVTEAENSGGQQREISADTDKNGQIHAERDDYMLIRQGDVFTLFEEKARRASELLNLPLTERELSADGPVDACDIPADRLEEAVEKLRVGHNISVMERDENGELKLVRRVPAIEELLGKPAEPKSENKYDLGYGHLGNGLTIWNRAEEERGDYKTVAHIAPDRSVTFYDPDMPENLRAEIIREAATSNDHISATQDTPVFSVPPITPEQVKVKTSYAPDREAYQSLIRMIVECEYFLSDPAHDEKRLSAGDVGKQVEKMRELYAQISDDPGGLTEDDIDDFARQMESALAAKESQIPAPDEPETREETQAGPVQQSESEQSENAQSDVQFEVARTEAPHSTGERDPYITGGFEPKFDENGRLQTVMTQADVDRQLLLWNGNLASKVTAARYLLTHGDESGAAAWLAHEFGVSDSEPRVFLTADSQNSVTMTWEEIRARLLRLNLTRSFFSEAEADILNPDSLTPEENARRVQSATEDLNGYAARTTNSGEFYSVGGGVGAELDVSGGVMKVSLKIQKITNDSVVYTLPDAVGLPPIYMSRERFETMLENRRLFVIDNPEWSGKEQPKSVEKDVSAVSSETPAPETPGKSQKKSRSRVALNYRAFVEMFPEIANGEYRYLRLEAGKDSGYMPLHVEWIGENTQNGDLIYDPEMTFRVNRDKGTLEPLTYRQDNLGVYQEVYPAPGKWIPALRQDLSAFTRTWFDNIRHTPYVKQRAVTEMDGEATDIYFDERGERIPNAPYGRKHNRFIYK